MYRTCCIRLPFTIIITYTIWKIELRPSQRLSTLWSISTKVFSTQFSEFSIKFIANLPFPCLFRWRPEPFKCSDEILLLSVISIFRELRCLFKFDIFNLVIPLSDLSIMFERITLDSGNSVWINFFSDKSFLLRTVCFRRFRKARNPPQLTLLIDLKLL